MPLAWSGIGGRYLTKTTRHENPKQLGTIVVFSFLPSVIYQSTVMRDLMADVATFGDCGQPVLLLGETGSGKELIAREFHRGNRTYGQGPFVVVHCSAIPELLFDSLFFGHAQGAYSPKNPPQMGYFEQARGGTLFLDELGELPLFQQVKLLRVLESCEVTPIGSDTATAIDFRLVAATNRDLRQHIESGTFRSDLFYRIAVIEIYIPNLDERGLIDRLALFTAFVHESTADNGQLDDQRLPAWLEDMIASMHLPGNVRQLRNLAERVAVIVRQYGNWDRQAIERALMVAVSTHATPIRLLGRAQIDSEKNREDRKRIVDTLNQHAWVRGDTAKALGFSRKTLWEKMKNLQIVDRRTPGSPIDAFDGLDVPVVAAPADEGLLNPGASIL